VIGMQPGSARECLNQCVEQLIVRCYQYDTVTVIGAHQLGVWRYLLLPSYRQVCEMRTLVVAAQLL
jgi:hypothetical protein